MNEWWWRTLFSFLVWPGLLGATLLGWFDLWLYRKLVARLQGRQGPPFYQPFFDFVKLLGKRTILPGGINRLVFFGLPLVALLSVTFALALLPVPGSPMQSFSGDLVVLLYLLEMPALVDILAGFATRSIYGQVGSTREAMLSIGYNLPFITALVAVAVQQGSFSLDKVAAGPLGPVHFFAGLALLLAIPARLKTNPFSIANAEQEIVAGAHVEYNARPLALFELTHALEVVAMAGLFAVLFVGPVSASLPLRLLLYLLVSTAVVALTCLAAAATARLKIQHAFRFFWTWGALAAALALASALLF
jgi:NADH-quinone oxidoreductase subunit H